jgi:hypothetical protein
VKGRKQMTAKEMIAQAKEEEIKRALGAVVDFLTAEIEAYYAANNHAAFNACGDVLEFTLDTLIALNPAPERSEP